MTEEERKAAWEEFENEKKGISSIVGNPAVTNVANFNLNVEEIAVRIQFFFQQSICIFKNYSFQGNILAFFVCPQ